MSARKCENCGSTDIESDPARADAVCTGCGSVVESGMIVSDVQFEENSHGGSSALGTFVSADKKGGGGNSFGGTFQTGVGRESREITLKNARKKIVALAQQLRLRPDHIDMAFYFFKLALAKHLTRGRKSSHVVAACVYITCRTEGTSHMLIDFSDILQVDVYELGRTYLRLSQALCINIPAMDPCLYVMRFAHKLEFGEKTHEVSMTALRLVSRMKKDWIHFGRRPSGLCGAALLIASRLHEFCRTVSDVIKVVKVHESTLRKRLNEFGETPASQLTLDEFMNVDLDAMTEEQDPPSYKAARKKDRERLERLEEETELDKEISDLEEKIEKELEERRSKMRGPYAKLARKVEADIGGRGSSSDTGTSSNSSSDTEGEREAEDLERFINEDTLGVIEECLDDSASRTNQERLDSLLMPPPTVPTNRHQLVSPGLGLKDTVQEYLAPTSPLKLANAGDSKEKVEDEELDITGIDDDEIDSYIMSVEEIKNKTNLWMMVNKEYLLEQEEKLKKEKLEREEMIRNGIDPDKKKKNYKKKNKNLLSNGTALEAIEKIVQEKKISTKINYDVLKNLNMSLPSPNKAEEEDDEEDVKTPEHILKENSNTENTSSISQVRLAGSKRSPVKLPVTPTKKPRLLTFGKRPNLVTGRGGKNIESETVIEKETDIEHNVIVESGPVELAPEEEELSDFSDDDEPMLSAAELLAQQFGESGYGEEEEFY